MVTSGNSEDSDSDRFTIEWNRHNVPVGKHAIHFKRKLSCLAEDNELFPIDKTWSMQCPEKMALAREELERSYDFGSNPAAHEYINRKMNKYWRNNYSTLLSRYVKPDLTDAQIIDSLPKSVNQTQFLNQMKFHYQIIGQDLPGRVYENYYELLLRYGEDSESLRSVRSTIKWNRHNVPVGKNAIHFKRKLSFLAKDNELFPIDKTWSMQCPEKMALAREELEQEFDFGSNPAAHIYINRKMNEYWRNNYTRLLSRYANGNLTDAEFFDYLFLIGFVNIRNMVDPFQFLNRMKLHFSEKGQAKSEQNKKNKRKQKIYHHTGAKSFACRSYEMIKQGMDEDDAWLSCLKIAYPTDEKIVDDTTRHASAHDDCRQH